MPYYKPQKYVHPVIQLLREIRIQQQMSQVALAQQLGYHISTISYWEQGHSTPSLNRLEDWANALGRTIIISPIITTHRK